MVRIFHSFSAYLLFTEDVNAAVEAIFENDEAVGMVAEVAKEAGYVLAITADLGNTEKMVNLETGAPHMAHIMNPVLFK